VYRVSGRTSTEVGVFGHSGWQAKHGFDGSAPPGLPRNILNRINGLNVDILRREGVIREGQPVRRGAYHENVSRLFRGANGISWGLDLANTFRADRHARSLGVNVWWYMTQQIGGASAEEIEEAVRRNGAE
jgi:hypothetical protein